jgi:hypothetical protein
MDRAPARFTLRFGGNLGGLFVLFEGGLLFFMNISPLLKNFKHM